MFKLIVYAMASALLGAIIGAIVVFLLTEGLPEGAVMGGLLGGSAGMLIAARRRFGGTTPSYEFETAGIHDDNLVTIARRNLARGAYRDSFGAGIFAEKTEQARSKRNTKRD
ncbi:MAG: hypothetical protein OXG53_14150 [Chloroflexi bacterium]|nr:hypothetical protein [Chloroflexota bacterium]